MDTMMSYIDNSDFSTYYTFRQDEGTLHSPMTIVMAGDEQCSSAYHIGRTHAEIGVLIYLLSGEGSLTIDGRTVCLTACDLIALPPGATYHYSVNKDNPWRILWFNIFGDLYPYLLTKYGLSAHAAYTGVGSVIAERFVRGMEICKSDGTVEQVQDRLCSTVYEIVVELWRQTSGQVCPKGTAELLRDTMDAMLSARPDCQLEITEISVHFALSVRQLERCFKKAYGTTPSQYFTRQKLLLAKQYLQNTALSVKEISGILGFCDQYYFSNCFKRQEGCSPKEFRKPRMFP